MSQEDWNIFEEETKKFNKLSSQYSLPILVQPKERSFGKYGKLKTRNWEQLVFEATEEDAPAILPKGPVSLQALLFCPSRKGDLSNMLKTLEDALNQRAYTDDKWIDYINILRVISPGSEKTLVKIFEKPF